MFLTRISVNNPVFTIMMMVALIVMGLFSLARIGVDKFPNIELPVVVVVTNYTGASPQSVETEVTKPIENAINTIGGIDSITSESFEGRSVVVVQFTLDTDASTAAQEVRDRVARLQARFADEVDAPQISRFNPDDQPVLSLIISGPTKSLSELTSLADEMIVKRLSMVSGVGQAYAIGDSRRQIAILLDPERMLSLGVSVNEIIAAVRSDNRDVATGEVHSGLRQRIVTVEGRISQPRAFRNIIVGQRGDYPVRLSDVAEVLEQGAEIERQSLFNGIPALSVEVIKVQDANSIDVARGLRDEIARLNEDLKPTGVRLEIVRDNSASIAASVKSLQTTMIEGGILTVLIVFLFLNSWRSTVITALTLPIAAIGTFAAIFFLGFTLNTMTLMALSLAIGILIDDAIVVRENITRHLAMGKSHRDASLEGTAEIGLAVFATTLSIVAVFLPVAFMGGIIGRFFLQFGITVAVAVMLSLFVAFTLDPMLSSIWVEPQVHGHARRGPIGRLVIRFNETFDRIALRYKEIIRWSFRHRLTTLIAAAILFVASLMLTPLIGVDFIPSEDQGEFQIKIETPEGSSLDYTAEKVRQVDRAMREYPEVRDIYSMINAGGARGYNEAIISVSLVARSERSLSPQDISKLARTRLSRIPGISISINQPGVVQSRGNTKPLQFSILGPSIEKLRLISADITKRLEKIKGVVDVESSTEDEKPTVAVRVRREVASNLGVSMQAIGETLRPLLAGEAISVWDAPNGESYDVVVRLPKSWRDSETHLRNVTVMSSRKDADGASIPIYLDQVADIEPSQTLEVINRKNLSQQVLISANLEGRGLGNATDDVKEILNSIDLPAGYTTEFGGDSKNLKESITYAVQALVLAVIFIYLILASQFGNFLQPLAVMISLPLSLTGALLALLVTGSTLNIFSIIGFIMLMGLVTKNAILLVDFSNQERDRGASIQESLIEAGAVRLRPIVMTTLAMIFGMLPLALGLGQGGEQRAPMAHAVIGGLISSGVLTLIVTPVILLYIGKFERRRSA